MKLINLFFLSSAANTPRYRVFENTFQVSDRLNAICAMDSLSGIIGTHEIQNS